MLLKLFDKSFQSISIFVSIFFAVPAGPITASAQCRQRQNTKTLKHTQRVDRERSFTPFA
jgi:hypothetical protein